MANIILSKESSNNELKGYFEAVLKLSQSDNEFPINLEDVWMLAYKRKDHAVRSLKKEFIEGIDFQPLPKNGERKEKGLFDGGDKIDYMLSTSCLEYFIARKVRPVFEVYRQVFHKAVQKPHTGEVLYKESEVKTYLLQADQLAREAVERAEAAEKELKKIMEELWLEKARVVIATEQKCKEMDIKNSCFGFLVKKKLYDEWKRYDDSLTLKETVNRLKRQKEAEDLRPYELPF